MPEFGFPKETRSQNRGRTGETFLHNFVVKTLGWVFRPVHQEVDFGIDAFVEVKVEESVTGRGLAIQLKCGDSYMAKRTKGGIRYVGQSQHLNYYLNHVVPVVLIVLSSDCKEGYWTVFDINRTNQTASGWWIEIPKANRLDASVAEKWSELAGPVQDYSREIQTLWQLDEILNSTAYRVVAIPMDDVRTCSMDFVDDLLTRLTKTRDLMLANRGKLEIYFRGYDSDPREICEIDEVRQWFSESISQV